MHLRTTRDPISGNEVENPSTAPCIYEGDGDNGIEIYFENEDDRQIYLELGKDHSITLHGNDSEDYVAEG
ncbi:MAG: hypothetical protein WBN51_04905 [Gammaproteobacteria bacterium]